MDWFLLFEIRKLKIRFCFIVQFILNMLVKRTINYLPKIFIEISQSYKQGKSQGFNSCNRPSHLTQIGSKSWIFRPLWPKNLIDDLEKWSGFRAASLLYYIKLCASSQTHRWIQTRVAVRKRWIRVKISEFFVPCDREIWWMTLKNKREPLLCYIKLCASFQSSPWIQTGVTVQKRSILVLPEASFGLQVLSLPACVCVCPCVRQSRVGPRDKSSTV